MAYRDLEPRGVTCVSDVGRMSQATGRGFGSTLFYFPQSRRGIIVDGPTAPQARPREAPLASMFDSAPDTVRGGKLWAFAYRGDPQELVGLLQQGFVAARHPHARAVAQVALPERSVGTSKEEARTRINGYAG